MVKLDSIRRGVRLTQGSPPAMARKAIKLKPNRRTRSGGGCRGWQIQGSTEDSGPMKPGNSVEDKTLTTGRSKVRERKGREPPFTTVNKQLTRCFRRSDPDESTTSVDSWEVVDER